MATNSMVNSAGIAISGGSSSGSSGTTIINSNTSYFPKDTVTVELTSAANEICTIAVYQSPVINDTSVYPIPLGYVVSHRGKTVSKTFTCEADTKSIWWVPVGWYYDQTVNGSWVTGVPEDVGSPTYPLGTGLPVKVVFG